VRSIFIFAHPDDEFGCYESIRREVLLGHSVGCYYLTDGGYGGQPTEPREKESVRVLKRLGVATSAIWFLGRMHNIPDGGLPGNMLLAAKALMEQVKGSGDVAAIYVPAWEGGHQDHDAAHVIGCAINAQVRARDGLWQYSLYQGRGLKWVLFWVMKPLRINGPLRTQSVSLKYRFVYLRLCLCYSSQWKTWMGLFPFVAMKLIFFGHFYLQPASLNACVRRPHDGLLLYERRRMACFEEVEKHIRQFVQDYGVSAKSI
jgi:hypothetical protein